MSEDTTKVIEDITDSLNSIEHSLYILRQHTVVVILPADIMSTLNEHCALTDTTVYDFVVDAIRARLDMQHAKKNMQPAVDRSGVPG